MLYIVFDDAVGVDEDMSLRDVVDKHTIYKEVQGGWKQTNNKIKIMKQEKC